MLSEQGGIWSGNGHLGPIFYFSYKPAENFPEHIMPFLYAGTVLVLEQLLGSCLEMLQKALKVSEPGYDCQPATQYFIF